MNATIYLNCDKEFFGTKIGTCDGGCYGTTHTYVKL